MNKKFLITCPNQEYWPSYSHVFLLGDFCINDDTNKAQLLPNRVTILNEIFKDIESRDEQKKYTNDLFNKYLKLLATFFNNQHNVNYPVRYWRIILGPWLSALIPVINNRWNIISFAQESEFDEVISIRFNDSEIIPYDMDDFNEIHLKSDWNSDLFSRILEFKNRHHKPIRIESFRKASIQQKIQKLTFKTLLKRSILKILEIVSFRRGKYFFYETYIPRKSLIKLQLMMLQIPIFPTSKKLPNHSPNMSMRKNMHLELCNDSEFEIFLSDYMKLAIPTAYIEGYFETCNILKKISWPNKPLLIFTSNAYFADEIFKAWVAKKVLDNTLYIIGQHGGAYGVEGFPHRTELHEKISSDYWLSWGWSDDINETVIPSLNLKLIGKKEVNPNYKAKNILQVTNDLFPYSRNSWSSDEFNKIYMNEQFNFASSLRDDIRENLVVRLHSKHAYYGVNQELAWRKHHREISINQGVSDIQSLIRSSRIIVSTYNATLFLETLALNIPTVIFWNPVQNDLSKESTPYFEMLKAVKILHDNPEAAANHVSSVWDDISYWWDDDELQRTRKVFCDEYSKTNNYPISFMKRLLEPLIKKNK
jgi:putative transferase (TIGR04331 family)